MFIHCQKICFKLYCKQRLTKIMNEKQIKFSVKGYENLPKNMNWDEFKATKDTKGKMAFIITDNDSDNIFDINDMRKMTFFY